MINFLRTAAVVVAITVAMLIVAESISAIVMYQRHLAKDGPLALARTAKFVAQKLWPTETFDKFAKAMELRAKQDNVYPNYNFDPQLHVLPKFYHLAGPAESTIVYCNENNFWSIFRTDEIGFRNPPGQQGKSVDYILLGDSYAEGACVNDDDTFGGVFRSNGLRVMNLGRTATGPLFQLATLREYGDYVKARSLVWFISLGTDLENLREEKTTKLAAYLEDPAYSQRLLERRREVSAEMKEIIDLEVELGRERRRLGLPDRYFRAYGETLDAMEAERKEVKLLTKVAGDILEYCRSRSIELRIVLIDHPLNEDAIQVITRKAFLDFSKQAGVPTLVLTRREFGQKKFLAPQGTHYNPLGYRTAATKVLEWIERSSEGAKAARVTN
jgi:hypothetical protein